MLTTANTSRVSIRVPKILAIVNNLKFPAMKFNHCAKFGCIFHVVHAQKTRGSVTIKFS